MSRNKKLEEKLGSDSFPPTRVEVFLPNFYKKENIREELSRVKAIFLHDEEYLTIADSPLTFTKG